MKKILAKFISFIPLIIVTVLAVGATGCDDCGAMDVQVIVGLSEDDKISEPDEATEVYEITASQCKAGFTVTYLAPGRDDAQGTYPFEAAASIPPDLYTLVMANVPPTLAWFAFPNTAQGFSTTFRCGELPIEVCESGQPLVSLTFSASADDDAPTGPNIPDAIDSDMVVVRVMPDPAPEEIVWSEAGALPFGETSVVWDYDFDGLDDVIVSHGDRSVSVYTNDGDGTFTQGAVDAGTFGAKKIVGLYPKDDEHDEHADFAIASYIMRHCDVRLENHYTARVPLVIEGWPPPNEIPVDERHLQISSLINAFGEYDLRGPETAQAGSKYLLIGGMNTPDPSQTLWVCDAHPEEDEPACEPLEVELDTEEISTAVHLKKVTERPVRFGDAGIPDAYLAVSEDEKMYLVRSVMPEGFAGVVPSHYYGENTQFEYWGERLEPYDVDGDGDDDIVIVPDAWQAATAEVTFKIIYGPTFDSSTEVTLDATDMENGGYRIIDWKLSDLEGDGIVDLLLSSRDDFTFIPRLWRSLDFGPTIEMTKISRETFDTGIAFDDMRTSYNFDVIYVPGLVPMVHGLRFVGGLP